VPLTRWTDFHNEDITMVRFYPDEPGCIVSSSIDGLLCRSHFDALLSPSEESSLQSVIQTGCPIDRFNFTPISTATDMVAVISPMRTAALVQLKAEEVILNLGDVRNKTKLDDDIIIITSNNSTDCPIMFTSSQTGEIGAYLLKDSFGNVEPVSSFGGVHSDYVRSMVYLQEHGIVYTGGEDSKVVAWSIN
jgi:WD repeat-containing protein 89